MEILTLAGYTEEEKKNIARSFLIPRQLSEHGLAADAVSFTDAALSTIVSKYTREAGVRSLERQIGAVARKIAARIVSRPAIESTTTPATVAVDAPNVSEYLGRPRFERDTVFRTSRPGVATGVA